MKRNGVEFVEIGLAEHPNLPRAGTVALLRAALRAWEQRTHQREETELILRARARARGKKKNGPPERETPEEEDVEFAE